MCPISHGIEDTKRLHIRRNDIYISQVLHYTGPYLGIHSQTRIQNFDSTVARSTDPLPTNSHLGLFFLSFFFFLGVTAPQPPSNDATISDACAFIITKMKRIWLGYQHRPNTTVLMMILPYLQKLKKFSYLSKIQIVSISGL